MKTWEIEAGLLSRAGNESLIVVIRNIGRILQICGVGEQEDCKVPIREPR